MVCSSQTQKCPALGINRRSKKLITSESLRFRIEVAFRFGGLYCVTHSVILSDIKKSHPGQEEIPLNRARPAYFSVPSY